MIRIDRYGDLNSINSLNPSNLTELFSDPLLSSSRIMEALFYKAAVIVEADSDSVFYQRVSRRIRPSDDIHYAHAHNKQTVHKIAEPYKNLGLKFAVIVDFDILSEKGEFKNLISKIGMTMEDINESIILRNKIASFVEFDEPVGQREKLITSLNTFVNQIKNKYNSGDPKKDIFDMRKKLSNIRDDASLWRLYKNEGYLALPNGLQSDFLKLKNICTKYGVFIVPYGELESWLKPYGLDSNCRKSNWITTALTKIPEIPIDDTKPLWNFISEVHKYLLN